MRHTLVAHRDSSETLIDQTEHAEPVVADPTLAAGPLRIRLAPGQVIPGTSWRIIRWLGEGAMGVVYEARHVEIDRRAAIKIVAAKNVGAPSALADLRSEARANAKIGSVNIAEVYDFAVLEDGRLMMAMEFVPGRSLHDIQQADGTLAPARLIGLFRQVCKALQAAHRAGLVHRDIKPENIMVGELDGRQDCVKLVDFGIATILGERAKTIAGTPSYMAPEGVQGGSIDGRYDIYSAGCVMFEMLCGTPPFVADTLAGVLEMHVKAPVPNVLLQAGPLVDPEGSARAIPHQLVAVIHRCLAKDPANRHESMAELEAALCEAQIEAKLRTLWDDLPLPDIDPARKQKLLVRMPTRGSTGRSRWWVSTLISVCIIFGLLVAWTSSIDETPVVVGDASPSDVDVYRERIAEAAAQAYYVYPPQSDPTRETVYMLLTRLEALGTPEALVAGAEVRRELSRTLMRLGDEIWDREGGQPFAIDYYVQAVLFDPSAEPAHTRAGMSMGEMLALRRKAETGEFSETELIAVQPLRLLAEQAPQQKIETIRAISSARAERKHPVPHQSRAGTVDIHPSRSAAELVALGDIARKRAHFAQAEQLYLAALRIDRHRLGALSGLGSAHYEQGQHANAVHYFELAVAEASRRPSLRIALGDAHVGAHQYDQALVQYERARSLGSLRAARRIERVERLR